MKRIVAIVEGPGDVSAVPALIAKTAKLIGIQAVASNPIKAGEWKKLRREGELERMLTLAASRSWDLILIVLDLEDDCVVVEATSALKRIESWKCGRDISAEIVFLTREYETFFLQQPSCLGDYKADQLPINADTVRGAKERVRALTGLKYKETRDQIRYTQALELRDLYSHSRAFRRLCRALSGLTYGEMNELNLHC